MSALKGSHATADDAALSKCSAARFGYFHDPHIIKLTRSFQKRAPLIHRGYFARVAAVRECVEAFAKFFLSQSVESSHSSCQESPCAEAEIPIIQIVSLGAGLDSTYFWMKDEWEGWGGSEKSFLYFEVDVPEVAAKKSAAISRDTELSSGFILPNGGALGLVSSKDYHLVAADLHDHEVLTARLQDAGFFVSGVPTLFIAECVLVYISATVSDSVIAWASNATEAPSAMVTYEQCNPHDRFGEMMMRNLEQRGCPLMGLHTYPTIQSQHERYVVQGWHDATLWDMNEVYDSKLQRDSVKRAEKLELFDELEEWRLIQNHYFVCVATSANFQLSTWHRWSSTS